MAHSYDFEDVPVQTRSPVSPRDVTKNLASNGLISSLSNMEVNLFPNQNSFPQTGFVRLSSILAPLGPIPVSKSTWWAGVKSGRYPGRSSLAQGSQPGASKISLGCSTVAASSLRESAQLKMISFDLKLLRAAA